MKVKRLTSEDAHALDVLLMNGNENADHVALAGDSSQRLTAVAKVLRILDAMPSEDPPANLAQRTVQRLQQAGYLQPGSVTPGAATDAPLA